MPQLKVIKAFYKDNHVYVATGLSFRLFLKEIDKNYYSRNEFESLMCDDYTMPVIGEYTHSVDINTLVNSNFNEN